MRRYSRRDFINRMGFSGALAETANHKTLVVVFLRGGADTLNMYIPYANDDYYKLRPNIAIKAPMAGSGDKDRALRLDDHYALHPLMAPLLPIYREGRMAIVQAVGTDNTSGSHFACQDQIEHGEAHGVSLGGGWLGRHLAARADSNHQTPLSAVAIGTSLPEAMRGAPAVSVLNSIDELKLQAPAGDGAAVARALAKMYGAEVELLATPGRVTLDLLSRVERMQNQPYKAAHGAVYPDNTFARGLSEVARLIKGKVGLEVASLDLGGWDTHFFQGAATGLQAANIEELSGGLAAFDRDLGPARTGVTTLVITEFGRRTYENSSMGTDHGRGFAILAIGDRICGGQVHGALPPLGRGEEFDILGPSGLQIDFDYRSVLSEVLVRALDNRNLGSVFPGFHPQEIGLVKRQRVA